MAPSTRGRSRKSSAEDISPSVAPTTPIVEQTTPVVTAVEGTSSTLSEGINQPSDSEEVSADIAYDDDSPSGDELGFMVEHKKRKTKKRKHSKRGLHAKNNRDEQLVKNILTLLKQNEFESESESESGFESESESEDQNRKKNVSSKSKYLKELTIGEKRVLKKNQLFKNLKCPEFTFSSKTTEITKYIDEFKYFCKNAHMTKGVDLIGVILSSLKGQSLDWFNKVIMKEDDFDKDDYNLKTFCQVFRQKYLPSDHLLTSFRGIFSYKLDLSDTRPGFDSVLESMNEVRGKITFDQMVALWYYCLTTPNSMQTSMDMKTDLKNMHSFIDAFGKHKHKYGTGKTAENQNTFNFIHTFDNLLSRNLCKTPKSFRSKRNKQTKFVSKFPFNKKAKPNNLSLIHI